MLLFLLGCDVGADDTGGSAGATGPADTAGGDTGADDTGDSGPTSIPAGPDCDVSSLPMDEAYNVVVGHVVEGSATEAELDDLQRLVEEWAPSVSGPWSHDVRGPYVVAEDLSVSGGGDSFAAASVADVIQRDDGSFLLFFVDGDLTAMLAQARAGEPFRTGLRGLGGLAAATSPDGRSWTPVALTVDVAFPAYAVDPEVVRAPDGGFVLYFLGVPAEELCADSPDPFVVPGAHRLYRSVSTDGLHWAEAREVWANPDGGTDPAVWCISDTRCLGWFWGGIGSDDGGLTWQEEEALAFDSTPQLPDVVQVAEGWRMFLLGAEGVSTAWSADGYAFASEGPLGLPASSPSAVMAGGEVRLYLSGPPPQP